VPPSINECQVGGHESDAILVVRPVRSII